MPPQQADPVSEERQRTKLDDWDATSNVVGSFGECISPGDEVQGKQSVPYADRRIFDRWWPL
ncbi:MAG: hypothetical protein ABJD11_13735 [Gemmatimonadota bacterium]